MRSARRWSRRIRHTPPRAGANDYFDGRHGAIPARGNCGSHWQDETIPRRDNASWALATSNPAESDGGKHAQPRSSNRPRHPDVSQSDDKRDTGKYIQGTHRTSPKRRRIAASDDPVFTDCLGDGPGFCARWVNVRPGGAELAFSLSNPSRSRPNNNPARCFATATDAHP